MRGRLIVFEGVEGCGKTTQLERSRQWLLKSNWLAKLQSKGQLQQLVTTREPGGTQLGSAIRQLLMGQPGQEQIQNRAELLLFAADRAQHVAGFLRPQLEQGALILCDRYTDSTVAYQGYGRGLDLSLIAQLNQIATHGLESDLTLWLDLDVEIGLARSRQRGTLDRIEQNDLIFHQHVQQGFAIMAQTYPNRIVRIDANDSELKVAEQIQVVLNQRLHEWYEEERLKDKKLF